MAVKGEVGWTRRTPEGAKLKVIARRFGGDWHFYHQVQRFDDWEPVKDAPIEDWLELLDAVERRMHRRKHSPQDVAHVRRRLIEKFPEHKFD
ncbi:MAG: NADP-dependent isocitrate dehydrogenase [Verrucomicrobia bacterium]|nr:NADP-dependent isocitrate dehydrogenase [Verrucomicrobiota bacterium]